MAQEDPTKDASPKPQESESAPVKKKDEKAAGKKPRRRRRWLWVLGTLFVLLLVLIALVPTIASTAMVRNAVVGQINKNLKGRVAIADWSVTWFSGIRVTGVKVYDA